MDVAMTAKKVRGNLRHAWAVEFDIQLSIKSNYRNFWSLREGPVAEESA